MYSLRSVPLRDRNCARRTILAMGDHLIPREAANMNDGVVPEMVQATR
jgi:hypothetical protein